MYRRIDLNGDGVLSKFELKGGKYLYDHHKISNIYLALKRVRGMCREDR